MAGYFSKRGRSTDARFLVHCLVAICYAMFAAMEFAVLSVYLAHIAKPHGQGWFFIVGALAAASLWHVVIAILLRHGRNVPFVFCIAPVIALLLAVIVVNAWRFGIL